MLPPLIGEVFGWLGSKGLAPADAPFWRYLVIDTELAFKLADDQLRI